MRAVILIALGVVAGSALGFIFFGGLWWTARRLGEARHPALLVSASLLIRLALAAVTLVVLARIDPTLLVSALVGMLVIRFVMTRRVEGDAALPERGAEARGGG